MWLLILILYCKMVLPTSFKVRHLRLCFSNSDSHTHPHYSLCGAMKSKALVRKLEGSGHGGEHFLVMYIPVLSWHPHPPVVHLCSPVRLQNQKNYWEGKNTRWQH